MKKKLYIVILISILALTSCSSTQECAKNNKINSGVNTPIIESTEVAENLETENTEIENTEITEGLENKVTENENAEIENTEITGDLENENAEIIVYQNSTEEGKDLPSDDAESSTQEQHNIKTDSRGKNGENSLAYLETLHENISQAMVNGELPFVSSCQVDEAARTVKVGILEMKDEYIQKLKEFENMGPALDIFQQDFPVNE